MILVTIKEIIHIPGDERSQTYPGHGYPERNQECTRLMEFDVMQNAVEYIKRNYLTRLDKIRIFDAKEWQLSSAVILEASPK